MKAIYIHIPKTAGTYVSEILTSYFGFINFLPILVNRRNDHDKVCIQSKIKTGNKNYDFSHFNQSMGLIEYVLSSNELLEKMGLTYEKWMNYTKFCFIRNPYERALSGWKHFKIVMNLEEDFHEYINKPNIQNRVSDIEYGHVFMSQIKHITFNNDCNVDIIGRFECLEKDLKHILSKLGFENVNYPTIEKKNVSNTNKSFILVLNKTTVNKLNEIFYEDFNAFHYPMIVLN